MKVTDQLQRTLELPAYPKRIVSLVPSQSELLWDLGLQQELVGITKFCIHPEAMFGSVQRVGGTKQLNFDTIRALQPDLIIGNKEENEQGQIEALMQEFPVWMSDIHTLEEALDMMLRLGEVCEREEEAIELAARIQHQFSFLPPPSAFGPRRVAYFIWRKPYMAAGHTTFIDHLLKRLNLQNVFGDTLSRYPEISQEHLLQANPDLILLSSEPYPFKATHMAELQALLPQAEILLVDGELFSWYGSRLLHAPAYFESLFKRTN